MTDPLYQVSFDELHKFMPRLFEAGSVPYLKGSPGIGKSAFVEKVADQLGFKLIHLSMSSMLAEDFNGIPDISGEKAVFKLFDLFPLEGDELPAGYKGFLMFLDEINTASPSVKVALYKLLHTRMVNQKKLHPLCVLMAAGNLDTDRAITSDLGTALKTRLAHFEIVLDGKNPRHFEAFLRDVALAENFREELIGFLSAYPEYVNNFKPDSQDATQCVPRTLSKLNRLLADKPIIAADVPLYASEIGNSASTRFYNFASLYGSVPKVEDILRYPGSTPVPTDKGEAYAVTTYLVGKTDASNIAGLWDYVNQFPLEYRILYLRMLSVYNKSILREPTYVTAATGLANYLFN